jgi:aminopeptidase N
LQRKEKKVEYIWSEDFDSTYLTSAAIGDFAKGNGKCGDIPLDYYWSPKIEEKQFDPMLTFEDTPKAMQFIQEYLHTPYPYKKYAQVAAEDFDFGGMENTIAVLHWTDKCYMIIMHYQIIHLIKK